MRKPCLMRLDEWLLEQGLFSDIDEARLACQLGRVRQKPSGAVLDKPGQRIRKDLQIEIFEDSKYVGRGGQKLEGLLKQLNFSVSGFRVLDVGSSTGGFADCLLQYGAKQITCIDVGSHQLHERLRADARIRVYEQQDIRTFDFKSLSEPIDLVTVDVSFISLKAVMPRLVSAFRNSRFILLFKPQFELDRFVPKKRGVAPASESETALNEMLQFLKGLGLYQCVTTPSAVKGSKGNQEIFIVASSSVPKHIFRTYDIRGVAERELPNSLVERIGRVVGARIKERLGAGAKIGVGRDARESSPRIHESLCRGLLSEQVHVIDLGCITTPMAYFAHYECDLQGVIQVTASHNPKDDNGMKMMLMKNTLFGDEIISIGSEVQNLSNKVLSLEPLKLPSISSELRKKYIDYLHRQFKFSKKFKMVLDTGNGMAGAIARDVFTPYASDIKILYEDVDCRFPNHEADPTIPANLKELRARVQSEKADIGFAYDGDADRLGVITSKGRILWGDEIVMLLSELVLKELPGSTIIGEVKCSEKLFRMIESRGGKPLMYKTGHSLIKKKMREVNAPIAGEMSGHLFFADRYFGFDDSIYATLRVLEVIDRLQLDLDEWIARFPSSFVTPEIRVVCDESEKEALVKRVETYFDQQPGAKLSKIDGVRVGFPDSSWALVRASNTQAVLVVRIEATSAERLEELRKHVSLSLGREIHV